MVQYFPALEDPFALSNYSEDMHYIFFTAAVGGRRILLHLRNFGEDDGMTEFWGKI